MTVTDNQSPNELMSPLLAQPLVNASNKVNAVLSIFLVDLAQNDDDPSSALLKEDYPDFVALMEQGICDLAARWNAVLSAPGAHPGKLYGAAEPVVRDLQKAVREFLLAEPPAVVIQAVLQMWSSFLLTLCTLRSAVMPQVEDGEIPAAALAIDVAPRQGGIVALPDQVPLPSLFKSVQGRGVAATRLAALSRSDSTPQRRLKKECRTDVAKHIFECEGPGADRPRSRKPSIAAKANRNTITYRGLANVFRCDEKRIHSFDEAGMLLLRREALQCA